MRKALLGAPHYVQEWIHLYDAGNIDPETGTNSDTCQWEPFLVIQVQALNMHGNNKGFAGPYSLSYTVAAVPWGKRWGKEQSHMGNRIAWQSEGSWIIRHFTLCNTFTGVAAHKVTGAGVKASYTNTSNLLFPLPECSSLFIFTLPYTHTTAGPGTRIHSLFFPHSLMSVSQPDTDGCSSHTLSGASVCVSHLVQACSFIDVTTKNKNDSCCAQCPGYQEQPLSSNSSKLPVCTYRGT